MMNTQTEIRKITTKVLKSDPSVSIVILGDRTGLTINRVSRLLVNATMGEYDLESIGAIASAVFCGAGEQGNALTLGGLDIMVAEFSGGKILTAQCGPNGILIVICDVGAQLGLIRVQMKRSSEELSQIMEKIQKQESSSKPEKDASIMATLKELENF